MLKDTKKIAVVGVGAVGSYLGAFLTREGHDVTLIDMWGIHVDTMKRDGLKVTGCQGDFDVVVNPVHLTDAINIQDKFDIILLAVKSYDTEWAAHFSKRLLANDGVIVSNQNCMNDSLIGEINQFSKETTSRAKYYRDQLSIPLTDILSLWSGVRAGVEHLVHLVKRKK